jgi:membrane fusion protein (multidrug efflux system)
MFTGCNKKEKNVSDAAITVTTAQARVAGITKSATYSGIVRGKNEAYILPKVSARVTGILVKPGDAVKAGQTLITLDSSDFDAAVKKAEAAVALARPIREPTS